ncbi:hypothetical protein [Pseudomonas sp. FP2254]|uniref:hypothetical protein n=1 Tax=Pseudomonas sp. FP2254 TaxID=2954087 RepID=UPI002732EA13|nr:hypothetical protein [Pseudomonas sp. FP2254]WLH42132.1 hypothetical protein PSH94_06085 [Pseudomonas sp. FP2254]
MDKLDRLNDLLRGHDCVMSVDIKFDEFKYDLVLTLSATAPGLNAVSLIFHDISALELNGFGGGLTQFMRLEASRVDNGLDRIRFEMRDVGDDKISFKFSTFGESNF